MPKKDPTAVMCHNIAKYNREHSEMTAAEAAEILQSSINIHGPIKIVTDELLARAAACDYLRKIAAGEYKPVVHGHWVHTSKPNEDGMGGWHNSIECSACREDHDFEYDYCPSCGALMDEKDDGHEAD